MESAGIHCLRFPSKMYIANGILKKTVLSFSRRVSTRRVDSARTAGEMACKVQAISQAVPSLERATARLAETVRNIQVEYSGRLRHIAQCCVAPHGIAWADASLGFKRSICPSINVTRDSPKRDAKKRNYLYKISLLH